MTTIITITKAPKLQHQHYQPIPYNNIPSNTPTHPLIKPPTHPLSGGTSSRGRGKTKSGSTPRGITAMTATVGSGHEMDAARPRGAST